MPGLYVDALTQRSNRKNNRIKGIVQPLNRIIIISSYWLSSCYFRSRGALYSSRYLKPGDDFGEQRSRLFVASERIFRLHGEQPSSRAAASSSASKRQSHDQLIKRTSIRQCLFVALLLRFQFHGNQFIS